MRGEGEGRGVEGPGRWIVVLVDVPVKLEDVFSSLARRELLNVGARKMTFGLVACLEVCAACLEALEPFAPVAGAGLPGIPSITTSSIPPLLASSPR